jgi:hypothetical protein
MDAGGSSPLVGESRSDRSHRPIETEPEVQHGYCRVLVLAEDGTPIPDALVTAATVVAPGVPGASELQTLVQLGSDVQIGPLEVGATIVVTREDYSTESTQYLGEASLEVILRSGWSAAGFVEWGDGSRVSDAIVMALPIVRVTNKRQLELIGFGVGGSHGLVARSGEDGSFSVSGLRQTEAYDLIAVGPGAACLKAPRASRKAARGHVVRMEAIYALQVTVADEQGQTLKTSDRLFSQGHLRKSSDPTAHPLSHLPAWLVLTGANWLGTVQENTSHRVLLLYSTDDPREEVSSIEFSTHVPGYMPLATELRVPRLGSEARHLMLQTTATADEWGDIEVIVDSTLLYPLQSGETSRNLGTLYLHGLDTTDVSMRVLQTQSGREIIRKVPAGTYEARFEARSTTLMCPPEQAASLPVRVIGSAAPAAVRLDPSEGGTFVLELSDQHGSSFDRAVAFLIDGIGESAKHGRNYATFQGPPYVIDLVPPGDYVVRIYFLEGGDPRQQSELLLPAMAGEIVHAAFPVRVGG